MNEVSWITTLFYRNMSNIEQVGIYFMIHRGGGTDFGLVRQVQNVGLNISIKKCLTSSECGKD